MLKRVSGRRRDVCFCSSWFRFHIYSPSLVTAGFGESGDPSCIIMQIWARIEVSAVTMTTIFKSTHCVRRVVELLLYLNFV